MSKEIIKGPDKYVHPIKMGGDTFDIIEGIIDADKCSLSYIQDVSKFDETTILQTCEAIYNFVRENIPYNEDEEGKQWIQSPGQLWTNRSTTGADGGGTGHGGDCKSMSIFCAAILKALGIYDFKYRFVSEQPDEDLYHVYLIVRDDSGDDYIVLDCTLKHFNRELAIAQHMDLDPAGPDATCPFPSGSKKIGATTYTANVTEAVSSGDLWNAHESNFASSYANNASYLASFKASIIAEIQAHFSDPTKKSAAESFINDNWANHLKSSALCIYSFWGNPNLYLADFPAASIPDLTNNDLSTDVWVGPTEITYRKSNSDAYVADLQNMGISQANIMQLVSLSVYQNHGITLDYMLYRCYNKIVYGQEWGPLPGIPYFNSNNQTFYANGATQDEVTALMNAFPIDGGTGKPWGTPYIARGVFIMTNGATDNVIANLTNQVNINGWSGYINKYIFPGQTKTYTPISEADIEDATNTYYNWQQGQLTVLYASPVSPTKIENSLATGQYVLSGPRIGQIIALITAILVAVAAIINLLLKFLSTTQSDYNTMAANPACAPPDFKLQYETADGCAVGYTSTCSSGTALVCSSGPNPGTTCNPNLALPGNQPVNNNFVTNGGASGTTPGSNSTLLMLGLGLAAVGVAVLTGDDE